MNYNEEFKKRTKRLALNILKMYSSLHKSDEIRIIGRQIMRSATSVAANYRASIRARSDAERYAKLCIVVEEADETLFWLEILEEGGYVAQEKIAPFKQEATEIVKVMATYRKKYKSNR